MYRKLIFVVSIMIAFSIIVMTPTIGDQRQPAPGNNIVYLHSTDGDTDQQHWMNADMADANYSGSEVFARWLGNGQVEEYFTHTPALANNLTFSSNGTIIIEVHMEKAGFTAASSNFRLRAGQTILGSGTDSDADGDNIYHVEFNPSILEVNASENLELVIENSFTAEGEYTIYTDGSSWIELPLMNVTEENGDDTTGDDDDDEFPVAMAGAGIGIFLLILILAILFMKRRNADVEEDMEEDEGFEDEAEIGSEEEYDGEMDEELREDGEPDEAGNEEEPGEEEDEEEPGVEDKQSG